MTPFLDGALNPRDHHVQAFFFKKVVINLRNMMRNIANVEQMLRSVTFDRKVAVNEF